MSERKSHVYISDLFAIIITFAIGVYSSLSFVSLGLLYVFMGLLRLFLLLFEVIIVRRKDDAEKAFKKERFLSRLTGIIMLLVYGSILGVILITFTNHTQDSFYTKHALELAIAYGLFTVYKFLHAYRTLQKAKRSYSPYRETIARLTYMIAFINLMPLTFFITNLIPFSETYKNMPLILTEMMMVFSGVTTLILVIAMLVSRRVPKAIKQD